MINSAVIIVRYFGGTKLGTGGLVRAYSDAVNLVLSRAIFLEYKQEIAKEIHLEYSSVRMIEYECEVCKIDIIEKIFDTQIIYKIKASEEDMQIFLEKAQMLVSVV
jgi:putative IMPACT (imprinted ancient) family translation regulator